MPKFIHAADLHLDSPLTGLERYEGAPVDELRGATRRALENLVRLALEEDVDFVLIAGDLYDGDWKDYNTGLFFAAQMAKLQQAKVPVVLIAGNHDAANRMTQSLRLPANVRMLGHDHPETVRFDELGVAIHGQSFPQAAVLEDLSASYPAAIPGLFNIGLLHTSAAGYSQHARYAPCTVDGLRAKGYDYWALGHIHQQEILHPAHPVVAFSGNTQGRHIKERGPKGCLLVEVDARGEARVTPRSLDVLRWEICTVEVANAASTDEVLERFRRQLAELRAAAGATPLAVRVELQGATAAHEQLAARPQHWTHQIRAAALEAEAGSAWIEQVLIRTSPPRAAEESADAGPVGVLLEHLDELRRSDDSLAALERRLADLQRKLPHELAEKKFAGPALWDEVEHLLVGRLQSASGERPE